MAVNITSSPAGTAVNMSGQSIGFRVVAACVCGIVLSTIALFLRMWSRRVVHNSTFWWDDRLAVLGWLFGLGDCALSLYWVHIGLGRHWSELNHYGMGRARLLLPLFAQDFLYNIGITMVKLSLICFYARVFRDLQHLRAALWATGALAVTWCIAATVASICTCTPVARQWNNALPGQCLDHHKVFLASAISNVSVDLIILVLPIPAVWSLQMSKIRRLGVMSIFALGCGRIVAVTQYQKNRTDFTWNWVKPQALLIVEIPLGVIGICLPGILLLARRFYNHGWRSVLGIGGSKQYRARTSLPRTHLQNSKDSSGFSEDSYSQFIASLGRGDRVITSTHASRDYKAEGLHGLGREEIQVRVDIEVDIDEVKPDKIGTAV